MKVTKQKLKQIIKEEMDDFEQDLYPGADERGDPDNWDHFYDDELPLEDKDKFVVAYTTIETAVESGQLPESVEDAVHKMLHLLGIHI